MARPGDARGGWRSRVRAYCAAAMLTVGLFGAPPSGRAIEPPAIVRLTGSRAGEELDPREVVGVSVALTLPLSLVPEGAVASPSPAEEVAVHLN